MKSQRDNLERQAGKLVTMVATFMIATIIFVAIMVIRSGYITLM